VKLTATIVLGLLALIGGVFRPDPAPELDHEPGQVHADPADSNHRHGDEDDHHDAPNTPCHHHESHSCIGHGSVHMMITDAAAMNSASWQRFVAADVVASSTITSKKLFHVPLA